MVTVLGEDPEVKKRVTCRNCGARLEYVPAEVKQYTSRDYAGGSDDHNYVDCPRCNHKAHV